MTAPDSFTSFDEFYRSQNVRLFHFFRLKVGREAAPDLVQEAFTRMLRCGAFERVENPQAYLTRTARNLLIERHRTWRRKGCVLYRSEEHTSELQSLMRISYAVFCLKKKNKYNN